MRIKQMLCLSSALAAFVLAGCAADTPDNATDGKGTIVLHVGVNGSVTDAVPPTRASQASVVPDASELNLKLTKADGSYAESWGSVAVFPADKEFSKGAYTLEAYYGAIDFEGFESPYYYGITDVNVIEGEAVEATVTASLANSMISIDYTDAFRSFFTAYSTQIHSEGGDFISFKSDETRPAYTRPGNTTVTISVTKQNGLAASIEAAEFETQPRHHYHITLDVNDGQTGQGAITVQFDDSIVTEDVNIDVSDQALMAPAPTIATQGFTSGQTVNSDDNTPMQQARMTINAPAGLSAVTLTTQSQSLRSQGFPAEIDLMKATEAQQALLSSFGLDVKGLYSRPDKMAVVDFSKVTEHITGAGTHTFTLVVKDKYGKVNQPVTLNVTTRAVNTNIVSLPDIRIDETAASMTVFCDGSNFADRATLQIQNNGAWSNATVTSITSTEANTYVINFNVPAAYRNFPVRLGLSGRIKATGTLNKTGVILHATETDVWAKHATFSVERNEAVSLSDLTWYVAEGSGAYSANNNVTVNADGTVTLGGLTSGAALNVKASDNATEAGAYKVCQITTEEALQLPNADMDTWYEKSGGRNWSVWYAGSDENAVWGTNNPMTTSQGSDFAYCRISGTTRSSDHTSGSYSALIRTVGWGSGNSATGNTTTGICKYVDRGLLHLGPNRTAREEALSETGIQFASRPSSLSFSYKYQPKNSEDYGNVLVTVYNARGEIIASGTKNITALSSFGTMTVPLEYSVKNSKAANIYVKFVSTVEDRFLVKTELTPPPFANLSNGTWMGSQLYIDNLTLAY